MLTLLALSLFCLYLSLSFSLSIVLFLYLSISLSLSLSLSFSFFLVLCLPLTKQTPDPHHQCMLHFRVEVFAVQQFRPPGFPCNKTIINYCLHILITQNTEVVKVYCACFHLFQQSTSTIIDASLKKSHMGYDS